MIWYFFLQFKKCYSTMNIHRYVHPFFYNFKFITSNLTLIILMCFVIYQFCFRFKGDQAFYKTDIVRVIFSVFSRSASTPKSLGKGQCNREFVSLSICHLIQLLSLSPLNHIIFFPILNSIKIVLNCLSVLLSLL